jgi:hypothetical protein
MTLSKVVEKWQNWREDRALRKFRRNLEKKAQKPRPILPSNRSSLTLSRWPSPAAHEQEHLGSLYHQEYSLLFSKLTFDTRQQIYRAVLGHYCFHIVQKGIRLAFLLCVAKDCTSHTQYGCWGYQNLDGTFYTRFWTPIMPEDKRPWYDGNLRARYSTDGGILPILQTCRLMWVTRIAI